jgi:hypothetical protein
MLCGVASQKLGMACRNSTCKKSAVMESRGEGSKWQNTLLQHNDYCIYNKSMGTANFVLVNSERLVHEYILISV